MKFIRCCSARGLWRAGLHLWTSGGGPNHSLKLPSGVCAEGSGLCIGVDSLTVYSSRSAKVWHAPVNSLCSSTPWQSISLSMESTREPSGVQQVTSEPSGVQQVTSGLAHTLILTTSGRVYSIGKGYFGQGGEPLHADSRSQYEVDVTRLKGSLVKQIACGMDHSLFLTRNGLVFSCGWAADGQTGAGSYESSSQLLHVDLGSKKASYIATCSDSSFAVTDEGEVFAWGNNEYGQLCVGSEAPQLCLPETVDCSSMDGTVTAVAAGGGFTAFLTSRGSVYLTGYNIDGLQHRWLLRQIHKGTTNGKVMGVKAGLNYLLAWTTPSTGLMWGKLQLPNHQQNMHSKTEMMLSPDAMAFTCGPLGLAAITASCTHGVLKLTHN